MPRSLLVPDVVTTESASVNENPGDGGRSREAIISLSVTFSVLLALLVGVAFVLVRLYKEKLVLQTLSSRGRQKKTSGVDRNSAERGSQAAWRRKEGSSSERNPNESRMIVNVSNELSSAGVATICASPMPPAPMCRPSTPARAPQVCRRKMLRSRSSGGGCGGGNSGRVEQKAGSWLHSQLPAASPLDTASPRRRCRSVDAPAEQPQ